MTAPDARTAALREILCCPRCRGELRWAEEGATCAGCQRRYNLEQGIPKFHDVQIESTGDAAFQSDQMFNQTWTAKLYNLGKKYVNSEHLLQDHIQEALAATLPGQVVVELGSGNRRLREDVITVELFPFPNVDLLADVVATPFRADSVDVVLLDSLIEHVPEPHRVIAEVHRILKPGGRAVCVVPFVFPYHGYPKHYCNYSEDGLKVLFRDFADCTVSTNVGPTSALTNLLSEYFAVAVSRGNSFVYTAAKGLGLLPIFLMKYADRFWASSPRSTRLASTLGAIAVK